MSLTDLFGIENPVTAVVDANVLLGKEELNVFMPLLAVDNPRSDVGIAGIKESTYVLLVNIPPDVGSVAQVGGTVKDCVRGQEFARPSSDVGVTGIKESTYVLLVNIPPDVGSVAHVGGTVKDCVRAHVFAFPTNPNPLSTYDLLTRSEALTGTTEHDIQTF